MKYLLLALCFLPLALPAQPATGLRVLSYNIRNAKGMDNQTDYARIVGVIKSANAELVALQELDSVTQRSKGIDVLQILAESTGMTGTYASAIDYSGGKYGVGILSKQKPLSVQRIPLPGKEEKRVLLAVAFEQYVFFCTHLSLTEADRISAAAIIDSVAAGYQKPIILAGDMNAAPESGFFKQLSAEWQLVSGTAFTFPAPQPDRCIDYILLRKPHHWVPVQKKVLDEPLASDHRPVLVELSARPKQ
jgi:endonuclease/exonuclease/phosphatase family metal-dependent hydrolase